MKFKSSSFLVLCLVSYAGNSSYSLMIPLYPPLASQKGLKEQEIGYVLCLYPVGQFIMSWILGNFMKNDQKKKCMIVGLILQIIGMLGFGILKQVNEYNFFIYLSCIFRLLTGIGAGFLFTPSYSLVGYLFQDNIHQALSFMEFISGLSMFSSPLLGSLFYYIGEKLNIGGYSMPFYFMSLTYMMIIPLVIFYLSVEITCYGKLRKLVHLGVVDFFNLQPKYLQK